MNISSKVDSFLLRDVEVAVSPRGQPHSLVHVVLVTSRAILESENMRSLIRFWLQMTVCLY